MIEADYVDDQVLPANIPAQEEFLLHSLKLAAYVNANKIEYMFVFLKEPSPLKIGSL